VCALGVRLELLETLTLLCGYRYRPATSGYMARADNKRSYKVYAGPVSSALYVLYTYTHIV